MPKRRNEVSIGMPLVYSSLEDLQRQYQAFLRSRIDVDYFIEKIASGMKEALFDQEDNDEESNNSKVERSEN
jgi:hypothetical protein